MFIVAYLMKSQQYIYTCKYSEINGGLYGKGFIGEKLYDFHLSEDLYNNEANCYKMASIILKDGNLVLSGARIDINKDSGSFANKGGEKSNIITPAGQYSQAYFLENSNIFYYMTYNDISDFTCGYSNEEISNYYDIEGYTFTKNDDSPLAFTDDVEIEEMNFMLNGKYAYYKIYNNDNQKTYHGIIDLHDNLVVFNTAEEINTFTIISQTEMLAITPTKAYKVCIIKDGDSCLSSCSSGILILDVEGNKCADKCEDGKLIKLPGNICIQSESCDTNIYQKDEKYCRLCKYINPTTAKYRLVNDNSKECRSEIPEGAEEYNTHLNLLRCKSGYRLDGDNCVTHCYSLCNSCSEYSTDEQNQKCYNCVSGYILEEGTNNCKQIITTTIPLEPTTIPEIPTTIINIPTTIPNIQTTILNIPTTIPNIPTTIPNIPTTIPNIPTTIPNIPTTIPNVPTTITNIPTTIPNIPTTIPNIPTTIPNIPTTIPNIPTTIPNIPTTMPNIPSTIPNIPTTIPKIPTTVIESPPSTVITNKIETTHKLECLDEKCLTCNEESNSLHLCLSCNEIAGYKKVNYTFVYIEFVDCIKKDNPLFKQFYFNETTQEYRPCYKTCKSCLKEGEAAHQNCLECGNNYMFRPGDNPYNNCVAYSEYYYINDYNQYKSLDVLNCPEEAKYVIKEKNCCINDCKKDNLYKYLYNARCYSSCPTGTKNNNFICTETKGKSYLGINDIYLEKNDNLTIIDNLVKTYISEFSYTNNHASLYNSDNFNILLYKNPKILNDLSLKMSKVDFKDCYEKVKAEYVINEDLITTIVDKKNVNNPTSFYSFYHPKTGQKLDAENICKDDTIVVKENLTSILDENDDNYDLQNSLATQGINIFDKNDPFYTDLCFDFENPTNKDIPLSDRIKTVFPNVTLCGEGCQNDGINLEDMTATCNCKFNDIANNAFIKDNAILDNVAGQILDIINSSNILVVKCGKYIFKYFQRSIGGIFTVSIIAINLILTYSFFFNQLPKITSYVSTITSRFISFFLSTNNNISAPPKKNIKNEEKREKREKKITKRKSVKRNTKKNYIKNDDNKYNTKEYNTFNNIYSF